MSTHISFRIPNEVMAKLKAEALEVERSLNWLVVRKLSSSESIAKTETAKPKLQSHHPRCKCSICEPK